MNQKLFLLLGARVSWFYSWLCSFGLLNVFISSSYCEEKDNNLSREIAETHLLMCYGKIFSAHEIPTLKFLILINYSRDLGLSYHLDNDIMNVSYLHQQNQLLNT